MNTTYKHWFHSSTSGFSFLEGDKDDTNSTTDDDETTTMPPKNPYLISSSSSSNSPPDNTSDVMMRDIDTSSVYSKDPPGEDGGSVILSQQQTSKWDSHHRQNDDDDDESSIEQYRRRRRKLFGWFPTNVGGGGCGCCRDWTAREKVLLAIVALNTLLIILLLATNMAILKHSRSRSIGASSSSSSFAGGASSPYNGGGGAAVLASTTTTTAVVETTPPVGDPSSLCGCATCTEAMWNNPAGEFTCGQRIAFLTSNSPHLYPTPVHACRRIAFEHPCACGACDPSQCSLPTPEFSLPSVYKPPRSSGTSTTPAPTPIPVVTPTGLRQEDQDLYCYPAPGFRASYTLWGGMVVEVKEDSTKLCGPGDNRFERSTVQVDPGADTITLLYTRGVAAEVRILLPMEQRPFTYGEYTFSVRSVAVKDATTGATLSNVLPQELVLGLFTWDATEDYAVHENYNHEVDIELSRWNCETNSDLQFLVQPPGQPQMHRLFSGEDPQGAGNAKYKQGGQTYSFTWNPSVIEWGTTAGGDENNSFFLKTEEAVFRNTPDYIQCLPDVGENMEVRLNLWNMLGARQPAGLAHTDVVEVVIDNFMFVPSGETHIPLGGICSKHCQCEATVAECRDHICTAK